MPTINMASIMKKVSAYSKSNEGKLRMKNCIKNYSDNGINKTEAGDRIIGEKDMHLAAAKMIDVLIKTARSYDLPASIMEHFEELSASKIYEMPDGSSTIYIYFGGDLHRESLYSEGYDGVDNIIAVLNNGYNAKGYVYGWWEGHEPTEDNAIEAVGLVAAQQTHISEAGKTEKVFSLFSRRFKILMGTTVLIIMSLHLLETITNKHLGLALCQAFSL